MKRLIFALLFVVGSLSAQQNAPPANTVSLFYCGSGATACGSANLNVSAICTAPAFTTLPTVFSIGATPALTSIVVLTNVGTINFGATSYLWPGAQIVVAGSTTSALNGTYRVTAVSGSTATITTSGVANATYNNAALTVSTNAPLISASLWTVQRFLYTDTSVTTIYYANSTSQTVKNIACSDRALY